MCLTKTPAKPKGMDRYYPYYHGTNFFPNVRPEMFFSLVTRCEKSLGLRCTIDKCIKKKKL